MSDSYNWQTNDDTTPAWVEQPDQVPIPATPIPLDGTPADRAAFSIARGVKHSNPLPVADDRGHPLGPLNPEAPSYLVEPDLQESQAGMQLPPNMYQDAGGGIYFNNTNQPVPIARRPGILPVTVTPEGLKLVMPRMADIVGNVMGNVAAPKVAAKAGEMVLGSGLVRTAEEAKAAQPFYSQLERTVDSAKINLATPEQWLGYLKNQPGVKAEEINTVLKELPTGMISKEQLSDIVKQNKVELKEKVLGGVESKDIKTLRQEFETDNPQPTTSKSVKTLTGYSSRISPEYEKWLQDRDAYVASKTNSPTQYHQYQLPGGENYKETLLSLPKQNDKKINELNTRIKELNELPQKQRDARTESEYDKLVFEKHNLENNSQYQAPHFGEHGTSLMGHVRTNERTLPDPEGKDYRKLAGDNGIKGTHIEELQSDWAQNIRDKGFKGEKEKLQPDFDKIEEKLMATNDEKMLGLPTVKDVLAKAVEDGHITKAEANTYKRYTDIENHTAKAVPDFPFKKNWDEVLMKRVIRDAVDKGHKFISATPGEAQALRYQNEIRQKVNTIDWHNKEMGKTSPTGNKQVLIDAASGELNLTVDKHGIITSGHPELKGKTLDEVIGKDIARQILEKPEGNIDAKGYVMGAEGMKGYYDKMVIDKFNNIGKKYGAKMEPFGAEINPHKVMRAGPEDWRVIDPNTNKGLPRTFKTEELAKEYAKEKGGQKVHIMHITKELEDKARNGFELFSSSPTLIPVDKAPDFEDKKKSKYRLTPIPHNPFDKIDIKSLPIPTRIYKKKI